MPDYTKAPEPIYDLLRQVGRKYKPEIVDRVSIEIILRDDGDKHEWKSKGRTVFATIGKVPDQWSVFLSADFLLTINQQAWYRSSLNRQRAILHHELCHLRYDSVADEVQLVGHDFEDFIEIVREHGAWTPALELVREQILQLPLPGLVEEAVGTLEGARQP